MLDVAPALCTEFPNLRFLWVGDGLLLDELLVGLAEVRARLSLGYAALAHGSGPPS